jgi:hypothetical protein
MNIDAGQELTLLEELRGLEELLAKPDVRRSPDELARLIADDFREFGGSGRIFDKKQIIAALQGQPRCGLSLTDFQAVCLATDVVLVTYRGKAQFSHSEKPLHSLRSSIWRRRDGKWQVVFHQGTPTEVK